MNPPHAEAHSLDRGKRAVDTCRVGTLVVRRVEVDDSRHKRRALKVLIDDQDVGRLKRGESATFELAPGPHTVQVAIDWARAMRFDISGDRDHSFLCGPGGDALPALLGINPFDAYLFLKPDCEDCVMDDAEQDRRRLDLARTAVARFLQTDSEDDQTNSEDDAEDDAKHERLDLARMAVVLFHKTDSEDDAQDDAELERRHRRAAARAAYAVFLKPDIGDDV
jgi:hypothetical protein